MEFSLCGSLSIKLVKIKQKRSYEYPSTGKIVRFSNIKYRLDNLPRPNHGMTFSQLSEITNQLNKVVTEEKKLMTNNGQISTRQLIPLLQIAK